MLLSVFERGIDINLTKYALKRAALLIEEYADGTLASDIMDFYPEKVEDFQVFLSYDKCRSFNWSRDSQEKPLKTF